MRHRIERHLGIALLALIGCFLCDGIDIAVAATPPDTLNYQAVLRDAGGDPLDGEFDMVFRFFDAENGGSEILVDEHRAITGHAIQVNRGLVRVGLGSGIVSDGAGAFPGDPYTTLTAAFGDFGEIWMQIEIDYQFYE